MLKPNKYTDIGLSVVGLSSEVMKILSNDTALRYNQLLAKVVYRFGEEAKTNFPLALTFLYSLDLINYRQQTDVVEVRSAN